MDPATLKEKVIRELEKEGENAKFLAEFWRENLTIRMIFAMYEEQHGNLSRDELENLSLEHLNTMFKRMHLSRTGLLSFEGDVTSDLEESSQLSEAVTEEAATRAVGRNASNVLVTGHTNKGLDCNPVDCSIPSKSPSRNNWSPDMCKTMGNREQRLTNKDDQFRVKIQQLEEELEHEKALNMHQRSEVGCLQQKLRWLREQVEQRELQYREQLEQREQQYREQLNNVTEEARTQIEQREQQYREQLNNVSEEARTQIESNRQLREQLNNVTEEARTQIESNRQLREQLNNVTEEVRQLEQQSRSWNIQREEVVVSDNVLGSGSWGNVCEGEFRGSRVAVKQLHNAIHSAHNHRLCEREIEIASRCRHPNLLRFIGATSDDRIPLFVTELLDCDLRHLMTEHQLTPREIVCLALDVAKGLNYLHCNYPPIVHRDIKVDNVLIWREGDTWRAKVSDFGAAKFVSQVMSPNPGAPAYSAPEAQTEQYSQPMDVYSFGLLLLEMFINEVPVLDQMQQKIELIPSAELRNFIFACIHQDLWRRPRMADVIIFLTQQLNM